MRVTYLVLLLTGCGSACSSSSERLPKATSPAHSTAPAEQRAERPTEPSGQKALPPQPLDPQDERVVYISATDPPKLLFAVHGPDLLVADHAGASAELSLRTMYGESRWSRRFDRVDDIAIDEKGACALADGHLWSLTADEGQARNLGAATGQLWLTNDQIYVHHLGKVVRTPRKGGELRTVVEREKTRGFNRLALNDTKILLLASAYRNRPARRPKLGWLLSAPRAGGELQVLYEGVYSPGPVLEVDGGYAYFGASLSAEEFEYRILRLPLEGRPEPEVVVRHPIAVFAVQDSNVYAAARLGDVVGVHRFPVGEGEPELVSPFEGGASRIVLDGSFVYWESRGRIYRANLAPSGGP